jgi:hypothetical protein
MIKPLTLALLAAVSCRKPVTAAEPPPAAAPEVAAVPVPPGMELLFWSTVAEAGGPLVQLRQTATARDRCHAEVTVGGEPRWSVEACVGTRLQLRFLSPDGERALVLEPAPEVSDQQPIDLTSLGRLWRHGAAAIDLSPNALRLRPGAFRVEAGVVRWLGDRDQRVSAQGVEVQLADGSLRLLRFDGADLATPPPPPKLRQASSQPQATCNPCSYTDEQGVYHMVENAGQIPEKFRAQASQVRAIENRADATPAPTAMAPNLAGAFVPGGVEANHVSGWEEADAWARERSKKAELEQKAQHDRPNLPPRERTHFERVEDMVDPMHLGDPNRDYQKIHCVDPWGKDIPCPQ